MCELCLDSREGDAYKRTKAPRFGPRGGGEGGRERNRRVYGSQNQHMHAPLLSAQVTSSSSYLSFFSMQQHPTQPTIEAIQKMIATMKRAGTGRARKKLTSPITKQTTAMM